MKIAVCISGQTRFVEKGYEYLEDNLLESYPETDIFVHTWYDPLKENENLEYNWNSGNVQKYSSQSVLNIKELYNPRNILIESPKTFFNFQEKTIENNYCSQFYSIKKCNELKQTYESENNFIYDIVIRTRFDWAYCNQIDFISLDLNHVYIVDANHTTNVRGNKHVNDQFAIGNSSNMNHYCSTYDNVGSYINENNKINDGLEKILYEVLIKNNISIKQLHWNHCYPPNYGYAMACSNSIIRYV